MAENMKIDNHLKQLGLPPMQLAESSNDRNSRCLYRCMLPALQKSFVLLILVTFTIGTYVLLLKFLDSPENTHKTEIFLVTGLSETRNVTVHQSDWDIFFQLRNKTSTKRRKRNIMNQQNRYKNILEHIKSDDMKKVKDIILQHHALCHDEKHKKVCDELITKLKAVIGNYDEMNSKGQLSKIMDVTKDLDADHDNLETDVSKREAQNQHHGLPHFHLNSDATHHLTDTCLLAKLIKQSYPQAHDIYNYPVPEIMAPSFDQHHLPNMRYFLPPVSSYMQSREIETPRRKLHPQDIDIIMNFIHKSDNLPKKDETKSSRTIECPVKTLACENNEDCIDEKQWCDGNVDCPDASDEMRCSCKSRVDKSRLCDGYFDCPLGEDEMECYGCSANTFSCGNQETNSPNICFTKEQRCNGIIDCPNHKDEIECNMLAPSLHKKPMLAISNTEGYLHRNFKGDWYAVCQNPYMWAHDACRRETGLIIRPPIIQLVQIDPTIKVDYLNTDPGGLMQATDSCFNSSAVYVTCPDFLCGTRVHTGTQLFRENAAVENHLFGRNKRFLYAGRPFDPYFMFYGGRMKRDLTNNDKSIKTDENERSKRTESRVVGGKPSQPAAWPWVVAIYRNGMFHCGGVILTQSWIISAAHCVHKFWENYYEIQVGMLRRFSFSPQEQNHRVTHIIVNQQYNQIDMRDDLSLLKVEPAIQFSRWVRPICLPGSNTAGPDWMWGPAPGTICTAVGWGATVEHGPDPDHMREVEVPIWGKCKHAEDKAGKEICAGLAEGGRDACQGDSGGPLLCRNPLNSQQWYLAGIVSHGDGCARKDEPGVYTRVSLFVKWIKYHINSKSLPLLQPIQQCPGFKCRSGILKCLPNIRKCDKIVDCLDADDETNCIITRSSNIEINKTKLNTTESKRISKTSREAEINSSISTISPISEEDIFTENTITSTLSTTKMSVDTTVDFTIESTTSLMEKHSQTFKVDIENSESKIISVTEQTPDFAHASTLEISPTNSSEITNTDIDESVTADPTESSSEESLATTSTSEPQMFTIASFKPKSLESRSSIRRELPSENITENDKIEQNKNDNLLIKESTTLPIVSSTVNNFVSRGDVLINEEFDVENSSPHSTETELDNITQSNLIETTTEKLIIKLLPQLNISQFSPMRNVSRVNNSKENIEIMENLAKNLPDFEDKSDVIQSIEDIVFSELQPANIRRKHLLPKEFDCRRIYQQISYNQRCDHKADCEDGTDELDCTCIDYLSTFDEKLICDGVFDCADGQDETDCFRCPENYFICKRSEICLPNKYVCDGAAQCPSGEDELNCFALSNGKELFFDIDRKPKINLEGFLTKRNKDVWQVECEDKLSIEQQEESAAHICRYLGFSSANRYFVKYINVKDIDIVRSGFDEIIRTRREIGEGVPIHFAFTNVNANNETARNIVIKEPQILKEECVPNVTKTCKSLYVFCDRSLYSNFDISQNLIYTRAIETNEETSTRHMWPWIAKVYVEGVYKCTGVLIELSWVLVSDTCLWDALPNQDYITAVLGSHRTLDSFNGVFEQIRKVDLMKNLYRSRVILLHLTKPAEYSNMVKPMTISSGNYNSEHKQACVAIGQDTKNNTISVFLNETSDHCNLSNRCFVRQGERNNICPDGTAETQRQWSGIISCHNEQGWYPAASFVESRGECGLEGRIVATEIQNLKYHLKRFLENVVISNTIGLTDNDKCDGVRCSRGKCVTLRQMCDGVKTCEDGKDEDEDSCKIKRLVCDEDPYHKGCECSLGQMKCKNGKCISKELFRNGNDDCGDETDEPTKTSCSDYLARVMPSRLCDGILHCHDRSDEDPMFCKCYAKQTFKCDKSSEVDHCVAPDMVCDGVRDCLNGEDERSCIGLSASEGTPYGTGQVIIRSHGVWHSKCYPTQNHTKSELEAICRELGFISGHAKEIKDEKYLVNSHNNFLLEPFSNVILNNQTVIKMRNTNGPVAKPIFDDKLIDCYPVFIECL